MFPLSSSLKKEVVIFGIDYSVFQEEGLIVINFELHMPTKIIFGKGESARAGEVIKEFGTKALLVTGKTSTKKTGSLQKIVQSMQQAGLQYIIFDQIEPNPRSSTVDRGGQIAREEGCDVIVALGGGSAMDAAKAIATVALSGRPSGEYIRGNKTGKWQELLPIEKALPIVTIPTLAATGSETNSTAVITNWETKEKSGIRGPGLYPKAAILDPELTYTVSKEYTADGVVDIFAHLYEGYFSGDEQANVQDEITEGLMRNVIAYGRKAMDFPEDYEARSHLQWTSSLALIGIANAGRGGGFPVHGMEHILSAHYDISHGRGLALLTPAYFEYIVKKEKPHRLARLGRKVFQINEKDDGLACDATIKAVVNWFKELEVYGTLRQLGIEKEKLPYLAKDAVRISGVDNQYLPGPRKITSEDVLAIFEMTY